MKAGSFIRKHSLRNDTSKQGPAGSHAFHDFSAVHDRHSGDQHVAHAGTGLSRCPEGGAILHGCRIEDR